LEGGGGVELLLDHDCAAACEGFQAVTAIVKTSNTLRASISIPRKWSVSNRGRLRLALRRANGHTFYARRAKIT
jgi:hypothetical protein